MGSKIHTIRINKDSNLIKYIKIIREYDHSLSIGEIKNAIEQGTDVVVCDFDDYDPMESIGFAEKSFKKLKNALKKAGAQVKVFHNGEEVDDDYFAIRERMDKETQKEIEAQVEQEVAAEYFDNYGYKNPENGNEIISITPYFELSQGKRSIKEAVNSGFSVPEKVIEYLKIRVPFVMTPGLYKHPFKDKNLLGPYVFTDGKYCWDRDTWKYILKYHVTVPNEFVEHVMSDEGTRFMEEQKGNTQSAASSFLEVFGEDSVIFIPENTGDDSLEDF